MAGSFGNLGVPGPTRPAAIGPLAPTGPATIGYHARAHSKIPRAELPGGTHGLGARTLAAIAGYVEAHLDASIGVSELASLANLSRSHFCRLFKRGTGLTPMAYLERSRIQRARDLIAEGRLSLAEIALECGFADQSHFTRRFGRQAGCTPAAFAREHCVRRPPRRPR